jgi:hypothetical protein
VTARHIAAISLVAAALAIVAMGVVRGALPAGPAQGERLVVALDPPVDTEVRTKAEHAVRDRLQQPGVELRIVSNGDRFVVEIGETTREALDLMIGLVERRRDQDPAMHVVSRTPFIRATGFFPRAWPFLAGGAVLLLVAGIVWRRK